MWVSWTIVVFQSILGWMIAPAAQHEVLESNTLSPQPLEHPTMNQNRPSIFPYTEHHHLQMTYDLGISGVKTIVDQP